MEDISLEEKGEEISTYMSNKGVNVQFLKCYRSPWSVNFEYKIINFKTLATFKRVINELKIFYGVNFENLNSGIFRLSNKCNRQYVTYDDCVESIKEIALRNDSNFQKCYFSLGKGLNEFIVTNLDESLNILIAGATRSGKTCLLNSLIMQLLNLSDSNLILIDTKYGIEFNDYKDIHNRISKVATTVSDALTWLSIAHNESEMRYKTMSSKGLYKYDGKRLVIIIDEISDLILFNKQNTEKFIIEIAQKSKMTGVHLIVATCDPSNSNISDFFKHNFPTKVCLTPACKKYSMDMIESDKGLELIGNGDSYIKLNKFSDLIHCQCPYITEEELKKGISGNSIN